MRSVRRTSTSSSVGTTRRRNIEEVTLLYLAVELDRVKNALEKKFGTGQPPERELRGGRTQQHTSASGAVVANISHPNEAHCRKKAETKIRA